MRRSLIQRIARLARFLQTINLSMCTLKIAAQGRNLILLRKHHLMHLLHLVLQMRHRHLNRHQSFVWRICRHVVTQLSCFKKYQPAALPARCASEGFNSQPPFSPLLAPRVRYAVTQNALSSFPFRFTM